MSNPLIIRSIEEFIEKEGIPKIEIIEKGWMDYTTIERLAAVMANRYLATFMLPDGLFINNDWSVLTLYNTVEIIVDTGIQLLMSRRHEDLVKILDTYSPAKRDINWSRNSFLPVVIRFVFVMIAYHNGQDAQISIARYNAWSKYKIDKIFLREGEVERDSVTEFRGLELRSPGHKKICARLAEMGYMFFFEAPCVLLGDTYKKRYIDLVVIANNHAVIVEIDGGTHRTKEQQRDDNLRDHLIGQNWTNRIRIEHTDAVEKTDEMVNRILSYLDPDRGRIA